MFSQKILNELLDKYEKSMAYKHQQIQNRRILLKCQKLKWVDMEDSEAKEAFHEAVAVLFEHGVVDYDWVAHEEDNLMASVWLIQDPHALASAYKLVGRTSKLDKQENLVQLISSAAFEYYPWMKELKEAMISSYEKNKSVSNLLYQDPEISVNMIRLLIYLDKLQGVEVHEKVLSADLFGDSKYFRKELKTRLHKLIERYDICEKTDQDLLIRVGIMTNPEVISLCGSVKLKVGAGQLDFGLLKTGAALPGDAIALITSIEVPDDYTVVSIENSAVYDGFIKQLPQNTLAIYHGGFAGRSKRQFFKLLYDHNPNLNYLHWSDIDLGGFRIFRALKDIIPSLEPLMMDLQTLKAYRDRWMTIDGDYTEKLIKLSDDQRYEMFSELIECMIDQKCRLEQENVSVRFNG